MRAVRRLSSRSLPRAIRIRKSVGLRTAVPRDHRLIALASAKSIPPGPIEVDVAERVITEPVACRDPVLRMMPIRAFCDLSSIYEADGIADAVASQDLDDGRPPPGA